MINNIGDEGIILTGNVLKKLMLYEKLPQEYENQENLEELLDYEYVEMWFAMYHGREYHDINIVKYCVDTLVKIYSKESFPDWWDDVLDGIEKTWRKVNQGKKDAQIELFLEKFSDRVDEGDVHVKERLKFVQTLEKDFGVNVPYSPTEELLPMKENKRRKLLSSISKRTAALSIAAIVLVAVPATLIALNTNLFGNIADFTQDMWVSIAGNEVQEDDMVRAGVILGGLYGSAEEFEAAHEITLLKPRWLPGNLEVCGVEYFEGRLDITYIDGMTWLRINFNTTMPFDAGDAVIHENDGVRFYIFKDSGVIWWEYGGHFYHLVCGFAVGEYALRVVENIK